MLINIFKLLFNSKNKSKKNYEKENNTVYLPNDIIRKIAFYIRDPNIRLVCKNMCEGFDSYYNNNKYILLQGIYNLVSRNNFKLEITTNNLKVQTECLSSYEMFLSMFSEESFSINRHIFISKSLESESASDFIEILPKIRILQNIKCWNKSPHTLHLFIFNKNTFKVLLDIFSEK